MANELPTCSKEGVSDRLSLDQGRVDGAHNCYAGLRVCVLPSVQTCTRMGSISGFHLGGVPVLLLMMMTNLGLCCDDYPAALCALRSHAHPVLDVARCAVTCSGHHRSPRCSQRAHRSHTGTPLPRAARSLRPARSMQRCRAAAAAGAAATDADDLLIVGMYSHALRIVPFPYT